MKKILLNLFVILFAYNIIYAQVKIGIKVGLNSSTNSASSQYDPQGYINGGNKIVGLSKPIISYQIGITSDIVLTKSFSFQPGILYTGKGTKSEFTTRVENYPVDSNGDGVIDLRISDYVEVKGTLNTYYIEIPLNFVIKKDLGAAKLCVGAGPYFGLGISGKVKEDFSFLTLKSNTTMNSDVAWKESDNNIITIIARNRFDAGVNAYIGLEFLEKVNVGINYGFGLTNLNPSYVQFISKSSNRVLSLTTSFLFGK